MPLRYPAAGQSRAGHYGHLGVTLDPINDLERQQLLEAASGVLGSYCSTSPFRSASDGDLQPLGPWALYQGSGPQHSTYGPCHPVVGASMYCLEEL